MSQTQIADLLALIGEMPLEQRQQLRAVLDQRGAQLDVHPLSSAQRRMWFLDMMYPGSPVYSVPYAFWLVGRLEVAALETALRALVDRHEVLRTVFFDLDGEPYQAIQPQSRFHLQVRHWRSQDGADPALVRRITDAEARRTFDLGRGPLLAATVLLAPQAAGRHLFLLTLHHIVCDGWSMGILLRELEILYAAAVCGDQAELAPIPLRYVDFARWEALPGTRQRAGRGLGYWRTELADPPGRVFAEPAERIPGYDVLGDLEQASWPVELGRQVEVVARSLGATSFMLMLAVLGEVLRRRTGASDLIVGTPVANRDRLELEGLVGFFVNTVPLRIRPHGEQSLRQVVAAVRRTALGAQEHQDVALEAIVDALGVRGTGSDNPLFGVCMVVQQSDTATLNLPGLTVSLLRGHGGTTKFDLTAGFTMLDDEFEVMVEYRRGLLARSFVRSLLEQLLDLTVAALAEPDRALDELAVRRPR